MINFKPIFLGSTFAAIFALGASVETNPAHWERTGGLFPSAMAQMPLTGCARATIPNSVDGAEYFVCDNGEFYREVGGKQVEVAEDGGAIERSNTTESDPEPERVIVEQPAPTDTGPVFKKAPGTDTEEPASTASDETPSQSSVTQ